MGKRAKLRAKTQSNVEIRYNDNGTVDEIIVMSEDRQHCYLHLEQMDEGYYWIGLPDKDKHGDPVHIDMHSTTPITARVRLA